MGTKLAHLALERAHWDNFSKHLPWATQCDPYTLNSILASGCMQVSTAFEHAVAHTAGLIVVGDDTADLSDGSDAKLSTVRTCWKGEQYWAPVTGIRNKTGWLRVQVYERKLGAFWYFCIPPEAHAAVKRTSNIEIPFKHTGEPRDINACRINWWQYAVPTWAALCAPVNNSR